MFTLATLFRRQPTLDESWAETVVVAEPAEPPPAGLDFAFTDEAPAEQRS